ncbi:MAG: hypothetical protein AB7P02_02655 [Alphaproteobacteria bacterium]
MAYTTPDGYLQGPAAARVAHGYCRANLDRCPEPLRPAIDQRLAGWTIAVFAKWIVTEFANARIPAYGMRQADGGLITLHDGLWRAPLFVAAEAGYGGGTGATRDPGLAFVGGKTFDLRSPRVTVLPVVTEHDLLDALGAEDLPPRPAIVPEDMPDRLRPPYDRAEAARWWLRGFVSGAAAPQRLNRNVAAKLCQDATGCTIDEGRAAYSALPPEQRNPSPEERNAARNLSKT